MSGGRQIRWLIGHRTGYSLAVRRFGKLSVVLLALLLLWAGFAYDADPAVGLGGTTTAR